MPSSAPEGGAAVAEALAALGAALRAHRTRLGVSAATTAEAAGVSRTTLHRIEKGEPSVTMGAYLNAAIALGLELKLVDPRPETAAEALPERIRVGDFPELSKLSWQRDEDATLTPREALSLYERNWRHLDEGAMTPEERALLETLVRVIGGGRPLVRA